MKTIKNCWLHTRIISSRDNDGTSISPFTFVDNNEAVNEYLLKAKNHEELYQQFNEDDFV
ncbi:11231_t:CDS:2 [Racocetra persica]|uniref:11231_t:CDS:1 n=1 Tax=Racocetra persica TaxID=160502 RepID=A0ACA9LNK0_9GLOM|nr:11231_t:CDS:2 [Racocetra persica]